MKKILLFIFILSVGFVKAQNYSQGVSVDEVIYTGVYSPSGSSCTFVAPADIRLDTSLFNYVSGLQFVMIVDSVHFPGPMSSCPVHTGDTIFLNSTHSDYSQAAPVTIFFKLKLIGVPTTSGQNYPCSIDFIQCTCNCYHVVIQASITNTTVCIVNISDRVSETNKQSSLILYPNPVTNKLCISGITQATNIKLYNSFGSLMMEQCLTSDVTLDMGLLPEGIYTLVTSSEAHHNGVSKKIVITR